MTGMEKPHFSIKDQSVPLVLEHGFVTTSCGGHRHPKILRYDLKALVTWSAVVTGLSRGTVFTMDNAAMLNVALMCLIAVVFFGVMHAIILNVEGAVERLQNEVEPIDKLQDQINAFVPFCLGYYLKLVLARWWDLRMGALEKVFNSVSNVYMIISCDLHEKRWKAVRNQVAKYGFAAVELLAQAARDVEDRDRLIQPAFLTEEEVNSVFRVEDVWQRPVIMWSWILRICTSAMEHQHIAAPRVNTVMTECLKAREGMAKINAHLDTQLPYAYTHLLTLLVNTQNVVQAVRAGIFVAIAFGKDNTFMAGKEIVELIVVSMLYQALLQISYMILDPFGDDVLDFPMKAYTTYLASGLDAMTDAQRNCMTVGDDGMLHRRPMRQKG